MSLSWSVLDALAVVVDVGLEAFAEDGLDSRYFLDVLPVVAQEFSCESILREFFR